MRVLVIDDDESLRALMADMLRDEGYEAVAMEPLTALAFARANPPDLIVLDVMMPGLDGPQVADELHADARTAHIPIVLCTAFTNPERWFAQMGASAILPKPFHLHQFLDVVRQFAPSPKGKTP